MSIDFLSSDAKELLKTLPEGPDLDSVEIVERYADEIVAYIERLEQENAQLRKQAA